MAANGYEDRQSPGFHGYLKQSWLHGPVLTAHSGQPERSTHELLQGDTGGRPLDFREACALNTH